MFECLIRRFSTQPRPIADCRPAEIQSGRIAKTWRNGGRATTIGIGRHICVVCDKTAYLCGALWATTIHRETGKTTRIWQADATGRVPPRRPRGSVALPCGRDGYPPAKGHPRSGCPRRGARPSQAATRERGPPVRTLRRVYLGLGARRNPTKGLRGTATCRAPRTCEGCRGWLSRARRGGSR